MNPLELQVLVLLSGVPETSAGSVLVQEGTTVEAVSPGTPARVAVPVVGRLPARVSYRAFRATA